MNVQTDYTDQDAIGKEIDCAEAEKREPNLPAEGSFLGHKNAQLSYSTVMKHPKAAAFH